MKAPWLCFICESDSVDCGHREIELVVRWKKAAQADLMRKPVQSERELPVPAPVRQVG
jgi:hypothetical protein